MALTRTKLDQMECGDPQHNHRTHHSHDEQLMVSGVCHLGAPTFVTYDKKTGTLLITCAECDLPVATVQVAR